MHSRRSTAVRVLVGFVLALSITAPLCGQTAASQARSARGGTNAAAPKLVVALVVDQLRYDFLERFSSKFGPDGFRKLIGQGASFTAAHYDYVPTYTAPGHASIFTGSIPAFNGIVGNEWFDRGTNRRRVMVSDDSARIVRSPEARSTAAAISPDNATPRPSVSPRNLIGTTLGDQLRLSNKLHSRVVAVSFKDRSAILPGGQRPNGAYWFDSLTGSFVTSDYYFPALPGWVDRFNLSVRPDKYFGTKWEPSKTVDVSATGSNSPLNKPLTGGIEKPGPRFYTAFESTPFASDYLVAFAEAAIEGESLGADGFTDLLSISFSGPDLIGHGFGPDSPEVEDTYIHLDQSIARLLRHLDRRFGLSNILIFLTADHGVAPVPEQMKELKFDARRIAPRDLVEKVNKALSDRFGEGKWLLAFVNDQLYLDHKLIAERKLEPETVERAAGEAALEVDGIADFFTRTQILEGRMRPNILSRRIMNGFNRSRSGDVWLVARPFTFFAEGALATTHGSPYSYDTHVPIVFLGWGVKSGRYEVECAPSDIAPTVSAILGIEPPTSRVGRVLPVVQAR